MHVLGGLYVCVSLSMNMKVSFSALALETHTHTYPTNVASFVYVLIFQLFLLNVFLVFIFIVSRQRKAHLAYAIRMSR